MVPKPRLFTVKVTHGPMSALPRILSGKYYKHIRPSYKTVGGIKATCTACRTIICGTTLSTGNFFQHVRRRHRELIPDVLDHCSVKPMATKLEIKPALSFNENLNGIQDEKVKENFVENEVKKQVKIINKDVNQIINDPEDTSLPASLEAFLEKYLT